MEDRFDKITNRSFAIIFTVMFITTLCGIIFKGAWWHIYTLIATGILSLAFWTERDGDDKDNSQI